MWEKSAIKRKITQEHVGNFKAGYVSVNEQYLRKTGIRGRKSVILFVAVISILAVALFNLLITVTLLRVLHLGYDMHGLEFVSPHRLLRILKYADMGQVMVHNGTVGGFAKRDLHLTGVASQSVILKASGRTQTTMSVGPDQTVLQNVADFSVRDPKTGRPIFSTDYTGFGLPKSVRNLQVSQVRVSRISSPVDHYLQVIAKNQIKMKGSEGLHMEGRELVWSAGQDLSLKSVNASIILYGIDGVTINLENLPLVAEPRDDDPQQYKICVCMPQGRLFRVPVTSAGYNCANAAEHMVNHICDA